MKYVEYKLSKYTDVVTSIIHYDANYKFYITVVPVHDSGFVVLYYTKTCTY